jgi:uncharacterized protein (DUF433 family)
VLQSASEQKELAMATRRTGTTRARRTAKSPAQNLIVRDPSICGGEPVLRGTRVTLRTILASLAAGDTELDILQDFPTVSAKQLRAVIAFAAAAAQDDLPVPGVPV